jgi:hypothetical protein
MTFPSPGKCLAILWVLLLVGCASVRNSNEDYAEAFFIPSSACKAVNPETAPIEELILTLPVEPFMREDFHSMVMQARSSRPENRNASGDFLYIGGDGSRGVNSFVLDRRAHCLKVTCVDEAETPPRTDRYFLYYTKDGWIRSHGKPTPYQLAVPSRLPASPYWEGVGG